MKFADLSPETQHTVREMAISHGITEEEVINRFYSIFRRVPVSRHDTGMGSQFKRVELDRKSSAYTPIFS